MQPVIPLDDADLNGVHDLSYKTMNHVRRIVTLLSLLLFVVTAFCGYSVYRQVQITNCVHAAANSLTGSVGIGDMVGCMSTH